MYKIHAYVLVPKSFMKFMFSPVYRVTQKDFYARPYTSVWAPVVARHTHTHTHTHTYIYMCACVCVYTYNAVYIPILFATHSK